MIDFTNVIDIMLGQNQVTQIEDSLGNVLWSATPAVEYFYVEDISGAANTLSIVKNDADAPTIEVFKSTDMSTWESMGNTDTTAITATVPANGKLYLKAVCDRWGNDTKYNSISCISNYNVGGNSMSLLYGDNFDDKVVFPTNNAYVFTALFGGDTHLKNAEDLEMPAETLVAACYYQMFKNCTGLVTAPTTLPAMTMTTSAYREMFYGCTSLTSTPTLPATTMNSNCYQSMFSGCSSLTTAPVLPATTLAGSCYTGMFEGCSRLTTAPVLSATTLANNCYQNMFNNCSSLTTAPSLPATTLTRSCYNTMFGGCSSLTTAPVLPATTLAIECCRGMFQYCSSLTTAPALPATTLTGSCYQNMFRSCTSLTTAPALPATTLAGSCYAEMFRNTGVKTVTTYANDISANNCLSNWLNSVPATGDFYNLGTATYLVGDPSGIPSGWTEHTSL